MWRLSGNISDELMCAMRVHLMNESEMNVFCPADAKVGIAGIPILILGLCLCVNCTSLLPAKKLIRTTMHVLMEV